MMLMPSVSQRKGLESREITLKKVGEYLRALRERHEIKKGGDEFPKVGEIVLIQSEAKNRREWKKA